MIIKGKIFYRIFGSKLINGFHLVQTMPPLNLTKLLQACCYGQKPWPLDDAIGTSNALAIAFNRHFASLIFFRRLSIQQLAVGKFTASFAGAT
ncbi:hypothetical protein ACI2KS_11305 [Pseudomonas sp. NPDC087358]|uniref:hypothetical protein n=1 Tax=Pseudomonas sp. NPDC087358 TaxID=3364439 RepID=UPI0038515C1C